ncbi:4'-phosphopantetheinyl transferase family protein [Kribbella swartbergensis]
MRVQSPSVATIRVHTVDLTAADIRWLDLLDDRERDRIGRCVVEADRARMLLGAALLRVAAGAALGVPPAALTVDRTCSECGGWHGRPTVPGADLDVSVSHSGRVVAVAMLVGRGRVGVDVQNAGDRPVPEVVAWTIAEARFKAGDGSDLTVHRLPSPAPGHVLTLATDRPEATVHLLDGTSLLSSPSARSTSLG